MPTPRKTNLPTCSVWFCKRKTRTSTGKYCTKHNRQVERTGNPLAGDDTQLLNDMCVRSFELLRKLLAACVWVDHNDIAYCRVCGAASAPHGKITHKDGCAVVDARDILLNE